MSESKSLLMPFIIVAVLIFGGAVAWKMMGNKETEITEKKPVETVKVQKEQKQKTKPEITIKTYEPTEPLTTTLTEDERAQQKVISQHFMKFSLRYQNEQAVEKGLQGYISSGNKELFDILAMFAEDNYPDLKIPSFE